MRQETENSVCLILPYHVLLLRVVHKHGKEIVEQLPVVLLPAFHRSRIVLWRIGFHRGTIVLKMQTYRVRAVTTTPAKYQRNHGKQQC